MELIAEVAEPNDEVRPVRLSPKEPCMTLVPSQGRTASDVSEYSTFDPPPYKQRPGSHEPLRKIRGDTACESGLQVQILRLLCRIESQRWQDCRIHIDTEDLYYCEPFLSE